MAQNKPIFFTPQKKIVGLPKRQVNCYKKALLFKDKIVLPISTVNKVLCTCFYKKYFINAYIRNSLTCLNY